MTVEIIANIRLPVPLSPEATRVPSAASASSMTTATGLSAFTTESTFWRFPSELPTHLLRRFLKTTAGIPRLPAKQVAVNVFPVPMTPQSK
jgi:hypothetical protein